MTLEHVFELIRKQETILWIGAGFSRYAGFPTGWELKTSLTSDLDADVQPLLETSTLRDTARFFKSEKGRKTLEEKLISIFSKKAKDTYYHDLLSHISYFRTIITTNYDQLIENAFTKKAVVVRGGDDILALRHNLTKVIKIHGDITCPALMVITTEDYANMHNRPAKDPFWSTVYAEIASKHIIFLGYGYEDENIWSDFDALQIPNRENSKKRIMISPSVDKLKEKWLREQKIEFIAQTGENFIEKLIEHLKLHVIEDMENKIVSSDIALEFINSFGLEVRFTSLSEKIRLEAIEKSDGPTNYELKFTTKNQLLIKDFKDMVSGEGQLRKLDIDASQLLDFKHLVEGFQVQGMKNFTKLSLKRQPNYSDKAKITIPDHHLATKDFNFDVFRYANGKTVINANIFGFYVMMTFNIDNPKDVNINLTEPEKPKTVTQYHQAFQFFSQAFSGARLLVRLKRKKININQSLSNMSMQEDLKYMHQIYASLLVIEEHFGVKFRDARPSLLDDLSIGKIRKLAMLIKVGYHAIETKYGLTIKVDERLQQILNQSFPAGSSFILQTKTGSHIIDLFNVKIDLGTEEIMIPAPEPIEIVKGNELITVKDKGGLIVYKYQRFGLEEPNDPEYLWEG